MSKYVFLNTWLIAVFGLVLGFIAGLNDDERLFVFAYLAITGLSYVLYKALDLGWQREVRANSRPRRAKASPSEER